AGDKVEPVDCLGSVQAVTRRSAACRLDESNPVVVAKSFWLHPSQGTKPANGEHGAFYSCLLPGVTCMPSASPKFRALVSCPRANASSTERRKVPVCREIQDAATSVERKKWTKWQKFAMTSRSKARPGVRKETTTVDGSTRLTASGPTSSEIWPLLTGQTDSTRAVLPRTPGMNRLSHAHHV